MGVAWFVYQPRYQLFPHRNAHKHFAGLLSFTDTWWALLSLGEHFSAPVSPKNFIGLFFAQKNIKTKWAPTVFSELRWALVSTFEPFWAFLAPVSPKHSAELIFAQKNMRQSEPRQFLVSPVSPGGSFSPGQLFWALWTPWALWALGTCFMYNNF